MNNAVLRRWVEGVDIDALDVKRLDWWRGFSAIVVLVGHMTQLLWLHRFSNPDHFLVVSTLSQWAVMVFFFLSGFLIQYSIANNIAKNGTFSARQYLNARLWRLLPPLWFSLLLMLLVLAIFSRFELGGELAVRAVFVANNFVAALTFTNGMLPGFNTPSINGPLWSLAHEFWFYAVALVLVVSASIHWSLTLAIGLSAVAFILVLPEFSMGLAVWGGGFLVGCIYRAGYFEVVRQSKLALAALFAAIILLLVISILKIIPPWGWGKYLFGVIFGLSSFYWLSAAGSSVSSLWRLLMKVRFDRAASYTYTLYIVHFPLLILAATLLEPTLARYGDWLRLLATVALLMALILFSERCAKVLENPRRLHQLLFRRPHS